jgi:hypothetical protein
LHSILISQTRPWRSSAAVPRSRSLAGAGREPGTTALPGSKDAGHGIPVALCCAARCYRSFAARRTPSVKDHQPPPRALVRLVVAASSLPRRSRMCYSPIRVPPLRRCRIFCVVLAVTPVAGCQHVERYRISLTTCRIATAPNAGCRLFWEARTPLRCPWSQSLAPRTQKAAGWRAGTTCRRRSGRARIRPPASRSSIAPLARLPSTARQDCSGTRCCSLANGSPATGVPTFPAVVEGIADCGRPATSCRSAAADLEFEHQPPALAASLRNCVCWAAWHCGRDNSAFASRAHGVSGGGRRLLRTASTAHAASATMTLQATAPHLIGSLRANTHVPPKLTRW